jgi:hypothetical protein
MAGAFARRPPTTTAVGDQGVIIGESLKSLAFTGRQGAPPPPVETAFRGMFFEEDLKFRPELRKFIDLPRPKSLVIPTFKDLLDGANPIADDFAKEARRIFIPILEMENEDAPLTIGRLEAAGKELPFYIMKNQESVFAKIRRRFEHINEVRAAEPMVVEVR